MPGATHKQKNPKEQGSTNLSRTKSASPEFVQNQNSSPRARRNIGNRAIRNLLAGPANAPASQSRRQVEESSTGSLNGLPKDLKAGIENLSGVGMNDVRVHYSSSKPDEMNALAHTQGNNIYLARGQESHLPHEAWHVVQQRQGRVRATHRLNKATALNNDQSLEAEADRMGRIAARANQRLPQTNTLSQLSPMPQPAVIQRKAKVPTGFGDFETTNFQDMDDGRKGVDIELTFKPDKKKIDATKIALVQSIKTTTASGTPVFLGVSKQNRLVPPGKSGAGYAIDAPVTINNPIYYNTKNLGPKEELKDTPMSPPSTDPSDPTKVLINPNYQLGYCYKEKPKDKDEDKKTQIAKLVDKPRTSKTGQSQTFETAALAIEGKDKNKYYGSVKWGYKLEEKDGKPKVTSDDISLASPAKGKTVGTPTENFLEPAKLWNAAESQGALQVKANVQVKKVGSADTILLTKGTKLKQIDAALIGENPAIVAEVLDGSFASSKVGIKNSDVEDTGGGSPNKKLPIP